MNDLKATSTARALPAVLSPGVAQAADEDIISGAPGSRTRLHAAQLNVSAQDGPVDKLTEPCKAELRFVDENDRTFVGTNGQRVAASISQWPGQARSRTLRAGVAFLDGLRNHARSFARASGWPSPPTRPRSSLPARAPWPRWRSSIPAPVGPSRRSRW